MALISVLQEQAEKIASGLAASILQIRNLRSCCPVVLYLCSQACLERGPFHVSWQCLFWLPLAVGMEEGELLHYHFQTPTSITASPFSQVLLFCLMEQKTGKELFAVSRSAGLQFWH